ncbi:uncharacterized protein LOC112128125 [Cimex lectularius]|uniref:Uncharacterized protein n=1 Tax=Cimex lectularius TaxID=79782 RepID=A0A8I6SM39_CIMLE|nr:uncharacterized protein LOC112128125 [Cimex lectularius]
MTCHTSAREVWDRVRALSGRSRPPSVPILTTDRGSVTEASEVAEELARHFATVSSSEAYFDTFRQRKTETERTEIDFGGGTSEAYNMPLTMGEAHSPPQLCLRSTPVRYVEKVRFLGLLFDKKLRWQAHIDAVEVQSRKALSLLRFVGRFRWGADRETAKKF